MTSKTARNPIAERARLRLAVLEAERVLKLRQMVLAGELTEQEAEERIRG